MSGEAGCYGFFGCAVRGGADVEPLPEEPDDPEPEDPEPDEPDPDEPDPDDELELPLEPWV